ncbi:1372_t:CDS:2 [Acaulospora morrowiae]|uniref:1372_t:CDS:1 n=1 Tax=Acaulospora morrowiae TaxID=94023 RepID=A0A9N9F5K9_9GLOM|nr:1372_t:CDS:2 [Acaulospora morrowiae]
MSRSIYKFGTPWSVTLRPRRLFQKSGASRRGSVVGALTHFMGKPSSITSRNSRIEFPFTLDDQENLRVAVQEQTGQVTQLPQPDSLENPDSSNGSATSLRKKGSRKFLSFSNIANINNNKNSNSSTSKKQKTLVPTTFMITIEDKNQILCIFRQISDFIDFDQQLRIEFPKFRPTLPSLDDRRKSFILTKHFFFRKSTAEKLESYLRKVVGDSNLKNSPSLREFLSVRPEKDYIRWKNGALNKQTLENRVCASSSSRIHSKPHKPSIDDYELMKVLGKGCMGKVFLSREKSTNRLYALKAISKEWVIYRQETDHTKTERDILAAVTTITHPFIIRLRDSFQDNNHLFLVLDYYPGGDIATQLAKWHKFDDARCLFYAAEIILGIEELHRLGIVYRILDTNTFCGTAEYLAPEIIRAEDYSYPVDWWSLGTLMYEMMTGITPFWAEDQNRMYQRVLEDELEFPDGMLQEAMSLLHGLLQRDYRNRLGCGPNGSMEIKTHPYFDYVDWDDVYHKRICSPYIPTIDHETDLQNFDDTFVRMSPKLSMPKQEISPSMQQHFAGYSFSDKRKMLRSKSSSRVKSNVDRKSVSSSLAGIQSHGNRTSVYQHGYDQSYHDDYSEMLYHHRGVDIASDNKHSRCGDDISEFELDQNCYNRYTVTAGESNKNHHHFQNPRVSQYTLDGLWH